MKKASQISREAWEQEVDSALYETENLFAGMRERKKRGAYKGSKQAAWSDEPEQLQRKTLTLLQYLDQAMQLQVEHGILDVETSAEFRSQLLHMSEILEKKPA